MQQRRLRQALRVRQAAVSRQGRWRGAERASCELLACELQAGAYEVLARARCWRESCRLSRLVQSLVGRAGEDAWAGWEGAGVCGRDAWAGGAGQGGRRDCLRHGAGGRGALALPTGSPWRGDHYGKLRFRILQTKGTTRCRMHNHARALSGAGNRTAASGVAWSG